MFSNIKWLHRRHFDPWRITSLAAAQFQLIKARLNGERKYAGNLLQEIEDTLGGQPRLYIAGKTVLK